MGGAKIYKHFGKIESGGDLDKIWHADAQWHADDDQKVKIEIGIKIATWRLFIFKAGIVVNTNSM